MKRTWWLNLVLLGCLLAGAHCGAGLPGEFGNGLDGDSPFGGGSGAQPSLGDAGSDHETPSPIEDNELDLVFEVGPPAEGGEDPEDPEEPVDPVVPGMTHFVNE